MMPIALATEDVLSEAVGEKLIAEMVHNSLVREWMVRDILPKAFLLRVAVRTIEAWLLADHEAIRGLLKRPQQVLHSNPEVHSEPKQELIQMARRGPRPLPEALVPRAGDVASHGLGYNNALVEFVYRTWSPHRAAQRSSSLARTRQRLQELAASMSSRPSSGTA